MLYMRFTLNEIDIKGTNAAAKGQEPDLVRGFICRSETGRKNVQHVS